MLRCGCECHHQGCPIVTQLMILLNEAEEQIETQGELIEGEICEFPEQTVFIEGEICEFPEQAIFIEDEICEFPEQTIFVEFARDDDVQLVFHVSKRAFTEELQGIPTSRGMPFDHNSKKKNMMMLLQTNDTRLASRSGAEEVRNEVGKTDKNRPYFNYFSYSGLLPFSFLHLLLGTG